MVYRFACPRCMFCRAAVRGSCCFVSNSLKGMKKAYTAGKKEGLLSLTEYAIMGRERKFLICDLGCKLVNA